MRFGTWRGVTLAIALATASLMVSPARAFDLFHPTIPRVVEAVDVNTGGPYLAPPIPYGHYAKEGHLGKTMGLATGSIHGLFGKLHGFGGHGGQGLCDHCGGKGCGLCKGTGLFSGHGHGGGNGCADGNCGGLHGGGGGGGGLFGHGQRFKGCGLCGGKGCGVCESSILPSGQGAPVSAAPQATAQASGSPCGVQGCGLGHGHRHGNGNGLGLGCNHGAGGACGNCMGGGGAGLGNGCNHGPGGACGNCMGRGLGGGGGLCRACGGVGCGLCRKVGGLLSHGKGKIFGLLHPHAGKIEYFVGPGGPVPITPGYVPYVVTTRSPRDFLSFPPFAP